MPVLGTTYYGDRKKIAADHKRVTAEIARAKLAIARDIAKEIARRSLTQMEAAYITRDAPSQISLVVTEKLVGFSFERLIRMRALLGAKVRVVASSPTSHPGVSAIM